MAHFITRETLETTEWTPEQKEAIKEAAKHRLEFEVASEMLEGATPEEALNEWIKL